MMVSSLPSYSTTMLAKLCDLEFALEWDAIPRSDRMDAYESLFLVLDPYASSVVGNRVEYDWHELLASDENMKTLWLKFKKKYEKITAARIKLLALAAVVGFLTEYSSWI